MKQVIEQHDAFPYCYLSLYFSGGPMFDPPGHEGLTELTNRMLLRGTSRLDRPALEEAVEGLGTELMTSTQGHAVGLAGAVLTRNFAAFAELLSEVLGDPAFAPDEVEKVKREMAHELETIRDADAALARSWFRGLLFPNHPLGHGASGTEQSLDRIDGAAVRAHYERTYVRARLTVAASGAIDRERLRENLPLDCLAEGSPLDWKLPAVDSVGGRRVALIDKPERTQAQIFIGQPSIDAGHPDFVPLHVAMTAFGGTFTARLMQEIRVKRGLSYGAYARVATERFGGYLMVTAAPEADDVPETLGLLFDEIEKFVEEGLSDEEIEFARGYLVNAFPFTIETPALRVAQRVRAHLLGRPDDFVDTYLARLSALSPDTVRAAVRAHVRPRDLLTTLVCTAAPLEEPLAAMPQVDAVRVYDYTKSPS